MLLTTLINLSYLCVGSMVFFAVSNPPGFAVSAAVGLGLGVALWWLARLMARLWNRTYRLHAAQQILCAAASLGALLFCVAMASVTAVDSEFSRMADVWDQQVRGAQLAVPLLQHALVAFQGMHPRIDPPPLLTGAGDALSTLLLSEIRDRFSWAVFRLRALLVTVFLCLQVTCFATIAWGAHRDIRPAR